MNLANKILLVTWVGVFMFSWNAFAYNADGLKTTALAGETSTPFRVFSHTAGGKHGTSMVLKVNLEASSYK